eukprot:3506941-Amphidinium_carterae.2
MLFFGSSGQSSPSLAAVSMCNSSCKVLEISTVPALGRAITSIAGMACFVLMSNCRSGSSTEHSILLWFAQPLNLCSQEFDLSVFSVFLGLLVLLLLLLLLGRLVRLLLLLEHLRTVKRVDSGQERNCTERSRKSCTMAAPTSLAASAVEPTLDQRAAQLQCQGNPARQ